MMWIEPRSSRNAGAVAATGSQKLDHHKTTFKEWQAATSKCSKLHGKKRMPVKVRLKMLLWDAPLGCSWPNLVLSAMFVVPF